MWSPFKKSSGLVLPEGGVDLWDERGFSYNGVSYEGMGSMALGMSPDANPLSASRPTVTGDLASMVAAAQPNSVVSAAIVTRSLVLSQLWPEYQDWKTGKRFRHGDLGIFERPGANTTLSRIWAEAEVSQSYTGNSYIWLDRARNRLRVLRPDFVSVVLASDALEADVSKAQGAPAGERAQAVEFALSAEVVAYAYQPSEFVEAIIIPAEDVAHWVSEPHPTSHWLGASWVTSCVREIVAEEQADVYADKFFEQGATPRLVYKMDPRLSSTQAAAFKKLNEEQSAGLYNSHKTLYVGGATDVEVVGTRLGDLALEKFRAMLESRISSRSRVPPQILQIAAGNSGSSLNGGNYEASRKQFADLFYAPYADGLMAAMQHLAPGPKGKPAQLSWDPKRVLLLQQDLLDAAEVIGKNMSAIRSGIDTGYNPDAMVTAVVSGDLRNLVGQHSGKFSVQLLPEGLNSLDANGVPVAEEMLKKNQDKEKAASAPKVKDEKDD